MVQKKSASVKSVVKASPKTKMKTTAGKSPATYTTDNVEAVLEVPTSLSETKTKAVNQATADKRTVGKNKIAATSTGDAAAAKPARRTASGKPGDINKTTPQPASSSRAKIAAAASRRANSITPSHGKVSKSAKSNIKNVASAVAKSASKQSKPVTATDTPKTPGDNVHLFKPMEYIVYPAHGVGQIIDVEVQEIAGLSLELFVITFEKDKMTLRVPTNKYKSVGMRKLSEPRVLEKAMTTLKGRARIKRTMWSRRAQEYEDKINSGDLIAIAEVVRDLYRSDSQPEQSYSERQLYEQALDRMAREIAAIEKLDERGSVQRITEILAKSAKGRQEAEANAQAAGVESDVEAA